MLRTDRQRVSKINTNYHGHMENGVDLNGMRFSKLLLYFFLLTNSMLFFLHLKLLLIISEV
jgi:hypothetical protein